jgi:methionyl aminopeptidase
VIIYKTPDEIAKMRVAGRITAGAIRAMLDAVTPGISTYELDQIAERHIRSEGGTPSFLGYGGSRNAPPFPGTICASIDDEIVHGIPSRKRILKTGDVLSLVRANAFIVAPGDTLPIPAGTDVDVMSWEDSLVRFDR